MIAIRDCVGQVSVQEEEEEFETLAEFCKRAHGLSDDIFRIGELEVDIEVETVAFPANF